jgi:hypothetical protein
MDDRSDVSGSALLPLDAQPPTGIGPARRIIGSPFLLWWLWMRDTIQLHGTVLIISI